MIFAELSPKEGEVVAFENVKGRIVYKDGKPMIAFSLEGVRHTVGSPSAFVKTIKKITYNPNSNQINLVTIGGVPLYKLREERKSPNKGALKPRELVFEGKDEQENVKKEDKKQKKEKIQRNRGKEKEEEEEEAEQEEEDEEDHDEQVVGHDGWEVHQKDKFDLCEDQVTKVKRRRWAELNKEQVWKRTEGHCYLCGAALKFESRQVGQNGAWHMEHILCLSNNPDFDTVENILPACARDNLRKGAHTLSEACAKYKWTLYSQIRDSSLHNDVREALHKQQLLDLLPTSEALIIRSTEKEILETVRIDCGSGRPISETRRSSDDDDGNGNGDDDDDDDDDDDGDGDGDDDDDDSLPSHEPSVLPTVVRNKIVRMPNVPSYDWSDFKVCKKLGKSTFGIVYLVQWQGMPLAVKVSTAISQAEELLAKELQFLFSLPFPHIVSCYGLTTTPKGKLGIVMEYVDGNDLNQYTEGNFSKVRAEWMLRVAKEIAMAMQFLHHQDVTHRDLKPANVLITKKGKAKVADFGLAKVAEDMTMLHSQVGTPFYRDPAVRSGNYNPFQADVYSYGKVLEVMVHSGKVPELEALKDLCLQKHGKRPSFDAIMAFFKHLSDKSSSQASS